MRCRVAHRRMARLPGGSKGVCDQLRGCGVCVYYVATRQRSEVWRDRRRTIVNSTYGRTPWRVRRGSWEEGRACCQRGELSSINRKKEQEIFRDPTDVRYACRIPFSFYTCAGASPVRPCAVDARERPHELDTKFSHMSAYNANISPI